MFENLTPEAVKQQMLAAVGAGGLDTREGSFADTLLGPVAVEIVKYAQALNVIVPIVYVDETSGPYIDAACAAYGIERKPGLFASAAISLQGTPGTAIPKGVVFLTEDGLEFQLNQAVVISDSGSASGTVTAVEAGERYNIGAGELTRMHRNRAGLNSWHNAAAVGGVDTESDKQLVERYYEQRRRPATSGNVHHYRQWALSVPGVGAARVTPLAYGPGTVDVMIIGPDRLPVAPESGVLDAVMAYIQENRPIGAEVTVRTPRAVTVHVSAEVVLDGSAAAEVVRDALVSGLDAYLESIAFEEDTLRYNRVVYLLLSVPGVLDFQSLTINGQSGNLQFEPDEIPILGEVAVDAVT